MTSSNLLSMIQDDADELTRTLLDRMRKHPHTGEYHKLGDSELFTRVHNVYSNLSRWIEDKSEQEVEAEYLQLGAHRLAEGFPLSQVVAAMTLTRDHLFEYIEKTAPLALGVEPDEEQELLRAVTQFFDKAIYYTIRGHEESAHEAREGRKSEHMGAEALTGSFYPTHHVVAVIDEFDDAERAMQTLRENLFAEGEIHRWSGRELLQHFPREDKPGGVLGAISALVPSEAREVLEEYRRAAEQGRQFILVHAPDPDRIELARRILAARNGTLMRHYGDWQITDLSAA